MKNSLVIGALCVAVAASVPANVWAQASPVASAPVDVKSGYDLFLQAGELLQFTPKEETITDELAPDEKLRRQRLAVARNAPALAKLREALKLVIAVPPPQNNDGRLVTYFPAYPASMEFSRQLAQESAVRAADGDALGAAQSGLDAMQLGAQVGHGVSINALTGIRISALGRKALETEAPVFNAAQSRAVAARLDAISAQTPQMIEILRAEEAYHLKSLNHLRDELNDPAKRAQAEAEAAKGEKSDEITSMTRALLKFPAAQIEDAFRKASDDARARAALPYAVAARRTPIQSGILYVDYTNMVIFALQLRFSSERDVVANRQLAAALRLHAAKLESGQYPETFDAGIDPFSPTLAPLIYRSEADSYILYSVGPDGKDEDGAEIQTIETDYKTGIQSGTDVLRDDSTGDIVAPVL